MRRKNRDRGLREKVLRWRGEDSDTAGRRYRSDEGAALNRRYREDDEDERPRVSFTHDPDGKAIPGVLKRFPAVCKKLLTRMFHSQFSIEDLPKLHTDVMKTSATELKDFPQLMRSFEVYAQIISAFTHESMEVEMQRALAEYRLRLYKFQENYTFSSIKEYHLSFVQTRILEGEDHPLKWRTVDQELMYKLTGKGQGQSNVHQTTPYKAGEMGKAKKTGPCWA